METDDAANPYAAPASPAETDDGVIGPLPEGPYGPFRDNRLLSRWVVGLVLAYTVPDVALFIDEIVRGYAPVSDLSATASVTPVSRVMFDLVWILLTITAVTFITFGTWIVRAAKNAWLIHGLKSRVGNTGTVSPDMTPGWAVGWHFIPVANLWKPFVAMKEIAGMSATHSSLPGYLLPIWWTCWLSSITAGIMLGRDGMLIPGSDSTSGALLRAIVFSAPHAINIALSLVACQLVRAITLVQTDSAKHFAAMDPAEIAPAWIHSDAPKIARTQPVEY